MSLSDDLTPSKNLRILRVKLNFSESPLVYTIYIFINKCFLIIIFWICYYLSEYIKFQHTYAYFSTVHFSKNHNFIDCRNVGVIEMEYRCCAKKSQTQLVY